MKIKKLYVVIGVILLLAVGGAGHFWYSSRATHAFKKAIEDLQKGLPVGSSLSYSGMGLSAYRGNGGVRNVFYDSAKVAITVSAIRMKDFSRDGDGDVIHASVFGLDDITINLKDKGIKYHVKHALVREGNLGEVLRAIRRSSLEELGHMLEAGDIIVSDIVSSGKAAKLSVEEVRVTKTDKGTVGSLKIKSLAIAEGGPSKSIAACAAESVPVTRIGDWAAATVNPEQEATLVSDITSLCK